MRATAWLRNRLAWSIRTVLSGSATRKFAPTPGAPTLLPTGGGAWIVHAEASMMVGGIRALLLQSLHPVAMQGVAEHSDFRHDPLDRLRRTVFFLGTTTYCSLAQAEAALEMVRQVHESVSGTTPDGRHYRADDPDLLAWVHATEIDSFLEAFLRYGRRPRPDRAPVSSSLATQAGAGDTGAAHTEASTRISMAELADRYVAEMATVAQRLGVAEPPRNHAQLKAAIEGYEPVIAAGELSRQAAYFLRTFPFPPLAGRAYAVLFWAAVDTLPRWAQDLHGLRCGVLRRSFVRPSAWVMLRLMGWALRGAPDPEPAGATDAGAPAHPGPSP